MELPRGLQALRRAAYTTRPTSTSPTAFFSIASSHIYRQLSTGPRLQAPPPPPPPPPAPPAEAVASSSPSSTSSTPLYRSRPSSGSFFDRESTHHLRAQLGTSGLRFPSKIPPPSLWQSEDGASKLWKPENLGGVDEIVRKSANMSMMDTSLQPFNVRSLIRSIPDYKVRTRPSTGRMVEVKGALEVARSFAVLDYQMKKNRVRSDVTLQRFHERPGLKRKRLKSERWIKRFKQGFCATCSRVRELSRQGW